MGHGWDLEQGWDMGHKWDMRQGWDIWHRWHVSMDVIWGMDGIWGREEETWGYRQSTLRVQMAVAWMNRALGMCGVGWDGQDRDEPCRNTVLCACQGPPAAT